MNYDRTDRKRRSIKLPELLAPAGSFFHLKAAITAGADAVYIGGHRFGARAYADNFSAQDVVESLHYAHFYGRKIYMTVNTLMKEEELNQDLFPFLLPFYEAGLDGVIVQDLGVASYIKKYFPDMEIHGSTQMTVTDVYGTRAAHRMGMTRVVPARELSLSEIRRIKKEGLEVEVFIHGALCYCYSGQCLMSSAFGGRSGNRGRCAQPCRLPWTLCDREGRVISRNNKSYLLSLKDLCALPMLPELVEAGVDSLKIEGRMKNVEYVAGVTAIYRKYLDRIADDPSVYHVDPEDIRTLEELYTRGEFTDGYFKRHNGIEMMASTFPRNTGRKIGKVRSVRRNKVELELTAPVEPKDLLVIPHPEDKNPARDKRPSGEEIKETLLTVPNSGEDIQGRTRIFNLPAGSRVRAGLPVYRRHSEKLTGEIHKRFVESQTEYPVRVRIMISKGRKALFSAAVPGDTSIESVSLEGAVTESSEKRPLRRDDVERQIRKTGNVPFYVEEVEIDLEEGSFLPMSEIKRLRQEGYALLQEKMERRGERRVEKGRDRVSYSESVRPDNKPDNESSPAGKDFSGKYSTIAVVYNQETLEYILYHDYFEEFWFPMEHLTDDEIRRMLILCKEKGKPVHLSLPRVFRGDAAREREWILSGDFDGLVIHNINEAQFAHELQDQIKIPVTGSASFYQWNRYTYQTVSELFPEITTGDLPLECSASEIEALISKAGPAQEILVYGKVPLMISAQCLKKTTGNCDHHPDQLILKGRDYPDRSMTVTTHCDRCYNLIWQDRPRDLIGVQGSHVLSHIKRHRFDLFGLDKGQIEGICQTWKRWKTDGFPEYKASDDMRWTKGIE